VTKQLVAFRNVRTRLKITPLTIMLLCGFYESHIQQRSLTVKTLADFLISNFRHVLNVVCFLLGDSPASEIYVPTFRNTLSVPSS
jgi:hypothetical protein